MKKFTHEDWRKSPVYEQELDAFLKTQTGQAFIKTLESSAPRPNRGAALQPNDCTLALGYGSGYRDCIDSIIALSAPPPESAEELKATYSADNNE